MIPWYHIARHGFVLQNRLVRGANPPLTPLKAKSKMARPIKNGGNEKREFIIPVRFTADEKSKIETLAKASGIRYLSDYLRNRIFSSEAMRMHLLPERQTLIRWLAHLGKIGSNLNQIAKVINRRELTGEKIDISSERVLQTLEGVDKLVNYLLEVVRKNGSNRKTAG